MSRSWSRFTIVEEMEKTTPQKYHEEGDPDTRWVRHPIPYGRRICLCVGPCIPETCPRYTDKCEECEEWMTDDGFEHIETGEVFCVKCVQVLKTMDEERAKEFFSCFAWPGGARILYFGKRSNEREPCFEYAYCGECAKHEHFRDGTDYVRDAHEEGSPYECENCGQRMCAAYGDPSCEVCKGEGDVPDKAGGSRSCPWCCDEAPPEGAWDGLGNEPEAGVGGGT
jgi:hypothetical protein